jgi:hypothetical protein
MPSDDDVTRMQERANRDTLRHSDARQLLVGLILACSMSVRHARKPSGSYPWNGPITPMRANSSTVTAHA